MKIYRTYELTLYDDTGIKKYMQDFVREEPLLIRVEDKPYAVVMRTPGNEIDHAAGFCLSEGLVESSDDISAIDFCDNFEENSVMVQLTGKRKEKVANRLARGGFFSQTSCGICGREMVEDLVEDLKIIRNESKISYDQVNGCVEKFVRHQKYYKRTRGTHAVMLYDSEFDIISKGEDVGRHNAMDKSIGSLFRKNRIADVRLAVISSRISFEMIQKAARGGIPILISLSNPTSMAVEMGLKLDMTLICLDKKSGFIVPCGEERVKNDNKIC